MNNFFDWTYRRQNLRRRNSPMPTKTDPLLVFREITAFITTVIQEHKECAWEKYAGLNY